ncbi:MAG: BolA family protein [Paracoccaceae bacterium]
MKIAKLIEKKLRDEFKPSYLAVVDDTESHRGHAGFKEGVESHFNVEIRSEYFFGKTRLEQHREVHTALGPEILEKIHALALKISA